MEQTNEVQVPETEFDYSASFTIGPDEHRDFCCITYARLSRVFLKFLIMALIYMVLQCFYTLNSPIAIFFPAIMLVVPAMMFFVTQKNVKVAYQKSLLLQGNQEHLTQMAWFGDKIIVKTERSAPAQYDYSMVTSISESRYFYILGLQYNVFLMVIKDLTCNLENVSFPEYILDNCPNIKKKKVQNVTNKPKQCAIYLLLLAVISLLTLGIHFYRTMFK